MASHFDHIDVDHRVLDRRRPIVDEDLPDADVVIATWWETAEWIAQVSPQKGAKVNFLQHYEVHWGDQEARVDQAWRLPFHKIVSTQWLADIARTRFNDESVSIVPDGVDTNQFHAAPRGKQARATVGMMYSSVRFKGCDISLQAVELASKQVEHLDLVAIGMSAPAPELPLPPGARYRKSPPQSELRDIYGQCDAWLFGSRVEGFGLPLLESMACRTPVIGTPAGAAAELLQQGGGILVKTEDPDGMADAIVKVCRFNDARWRAMSDLAWATAGRYTWDNGAELFEKALQTAMERARRGEIAGGLSQIQTVS